MRSERTRSRPLASKLRVPLVRHPLWGAALPAYAYGVLLLVLGVLPPFPMMPGPELPMPNDKLQHLLAFAVFAWLSARARRLAVPEEPWWKIQAFGFGAAIGLGALLEVIQSQVPWRSAEFRDLLADAAGGLVGVAFMELVHRLGLRGRPEEAAPPR